MYSGTILVFNVRSDGRVDKINSKVIPPLTMKKIPLIHLCRRCFVPVSLKDCGRTILLYQGSLLLVALVSYCYNFMITLEATSHTVCSLTSGHRNSGSTQGFSYLFQFLLHFSATLPANNKTCVL